MTSVLLDLSDHCIETAARRAHRELTDALVRGSHDRDAGARLRLLQDFLEGTDFAALRTRDPRLAGGRTVRVRLTRAPSGQVTWALEP